MHIAEAIYTHTCYSGASLGRMRNLNKGAFSACALCFYSQDICLTQLAGGRMTDLAPKLATCYQSRIFNRSRRVLVTERQRLRKWERRALAFIVRVCIKVHFHNTVPSTIPSGLQQLVCNASHLWFQVGMYLLLNGWGVGWRWRPGRLCL